MYDTIEKTILAGSVLLPAGVSEKMGMKNRDWNRREREENREREFLWLGTLHQQRRGLSCVYNVRE